ncbi:MAG: hypothetical protein J6K96_04020 [Treponema sp.]|nr:hypothetical protein [Treponema sp.]
MILVSGVLALLPGILVGYFGGFGSGFLIYVISIFTSFIGFKIGSAVKNFMGEYFVATKSYGDLFFAKLFALYGPQVVGFLIGLCVPAIIFFDRFDMAAWALDE